MPLSEILQQLTECTGVPFIPAKPRDLEILRELGAPAWLVEFYSTSEPESMGGGIYTIDEIASSTEHRLPGSAAFPLGYLPVADEISGDEYCLDLKSQEPRFLRLSHESVHEGVSREQIEAKAEQIADSLEAFLAHQVQELS